MEMHELVKSLEALDQKLVAIKSMLRLAEKEKEITALEAEVNAPGFWSDQKKAVGKSQKLGWLKEEKEHWGKLAKEIKDLLEMAELDEADKEVNLREEIEKQYQSLNKQVSELEFNTLMSEKHDSENAIVAIHSGSGGTEAQDWAEMLLRMIMRYCEKKGWKAVMLDESRGQEAGIKAAVLRVEGEYVYGHLKSEHGTHRLVRISPFDAEKMRHTSFALIEVIPEVEAGG